MLERGKLFNRSHRRKSNVIGVIGSMTLFPFLFFSKPTNEIVQQRIKECRKFWFQSLPCTKKQHLCHCCGLLNDAFSLYSSKRQLMRLLKKRRMQCTNVEKFGFNRCHTRKSNTSSIAVACLMTLFSLCCSKWQLMRLLKKE